MNQNVNLGMEQSSPRRSNFSNEMDEIRIRQPNIGQSSPGTGQPANVQSKVLQLCLPGLEFLIGTEQVFIHQEVNLRELFSNVPNDFDVLTSNGQRLFKITEATGQVARTMGGGHQNFEMKFADDSGNEVIRIQGQPGFYGGRAVSVPKCPQCVSVFYVHGGSDQKIGEVVQVRIGCHLEYSVRDAFGNSMLRILGPKFGDFCCGIFMLGSVAFPVVSLDKKTIVGGIGKLWGGFAREMFTMADNYGVQFPSDLDITTKCLLLSAAIMLDFQFFERQ